MAFTSPREMAETIVVLSNVPAATKLQSTATNSATKQIEGHDADLERARTAVNNHRDWAERKWNEEQQGHRFTDPEPFVSEEDRALVTQANQMASMQVLIRNLPTGTSLLHS